MKRHGLNIVPWRTFRGKAVHTNGYIEEALGLLPLIAGWGPEGFYVARDAAPKQLSAYLDTVDWGRVSLVDKTFEPRLGAGVISISDDETYEVSVRRFQRLIRHCFVKVPREKFEREVAAAKRLSSERSHIHGHL